MVRCSPGRGSSCRRGSGWTRRWPSSGVWVHAGPLRRWKAPSPPWHRIDPPRSWWSRIRASTGCATMLQRLWTTVGALQTVGGVYATEVTPASHRAGDCPMTAAITYLSHPPSTAQIVIVGGGVVGAATAFYAARAGLRPVLLERRPALCTLTTPVATGAFRLQFDNREELELVRRSVELFLNFAEITRQRDYDLSIRQQGYLWLTTSEAGAERQRRLVAAQQAWGQHDVELLGRDEVRHRFPYVAAHVMQARFRAGDGFLDSKALTMGLVAASGAAVVVGCGVTGLRVQSGRVTGREAVPGTGRTRT